MAAAPLGHGVEEVGLPDAALTHDQRQVRGVAGHHGAPRVAKDAELSVPAHERPGTRAGRLPQAGPARPRRPRVTQEGELQLGRGAVRLGAEVLAQRPRQSVVRRQRSRDLSVRGQRPHEVAHRPLVVRVGRHAGRRHRHRPRRVDLEERGHPLVDRVAPQRVGLASHLEDPAVVVHVRQGRPRAEHVLGRGGRGLGQGVLAGRRPAGGLRTPLAGLIEVHGPPTAQDVRAVQAHDEVRRRQHACSRLTSVATLAAGSAGGSSCHSASTMRSVATAAPRAAASSASTARALRLPRALPVSAPAPASTARMDDRRSRTTPSCVLTEPSIRPATRSGQPSVDPSQPTSRSRRCSSWRAGSPVSPPCTGPG